MKGVDHENQGRDDRCATDVHSRHESRGRGGTDVGGDCGILPVVDDGKLVGVVTDRDMYHRRSWIRFRPFAPITIHCHTFSPPDVVPSETPIIADPAIPDRCPSSVSLTRERGRARRAADQERISYRHSEGAPCSSHQHAVPPAKARLNPPAPHAQAGDGEARDYIAPTRQFRATADQ